LADRILLNFIRETPSSFSWTWKLLSTEKPSRFWQISNNFSQF
jgi:hypothetical protein